MEFLLSSVLLLTTIFAALQMFVLIYTYVIMAEAAKQGVRYAVVHGSLSSVTGTTAIQDAVKKYADYPGMTIAVTYPDGGTAPSQRVEVTLSYPSFTLFSLGWALPTINASARGRYFY